ncbi:winged helix-turn-helix domain-containing protein [Bifidobacterium aesculapii]|uniref:winged helix-turn-helix domain-containing protein n=1 Tax=Bifidobacterium aesculapii TaxID=1329411 RepID=UPI0006E45A9C|nr:helix-turn-helix domain-containing protein [Bifidobacterium aesculapii]
MTDETPQRHALLEDTAVKVADSAALRAVANPVRMRILGTLRVDGVQTVGSISGRIGEAPGVVSYHLGQLARAGFVEKVESPDGDRRKSWWRACQDAIRPDVPASRSDRAGADAMDLFRRSAAVSYEMAYERYLDRVPDLPREWVDNCTSDDHVLNLNVSEMKEMIGELNEVIRRWEQVGAGRADGGNDAERVALVLQVFRWMP